MKTGEQRFFGGLITGAMFAGLFILIIQGAAYMVSGEGVSAGIIVPIFTGVGGFIWGALTVLD